MGREGVGWVECGEGGSWVWGVRGVGVCSLFVPPPPRLGAVEPELLTLFGVMPSLEENLTNRLRGLTRGKEQEIQAAGGRHRQAVAKMSRFQTQQEELE